MRSLIWGKTFVRAFKRVIKKNLHFSPDIEETLELLAENPYAPILTTHKLKGKLSGLWACRAGYDLRIIFDFVKSENQTEEDILLLGIGTHDDVY
jgi:addiction module RelE/StbE family toxin